MPTFQYHPDILAQFPDLRAAVLVAAELNNGPSSDELQAAFVEEQRATLDSIGDTPLSQLDTLAAWRAAFRTFGVNPTKYRSAPEALLRRLTKKGDIPSINTLVDICNLVSIRYTLPVAAFDTHALDLPVRVLFAEGDERFTPLGESQVEHPDRGEVVFSDQTGLVVARRWCWRQSDESAASSSTQQAFFTIEAQHPGGYSDVQHALEDLLALLQTYTGGTYTSALLGSHNPEI
jgi:DNA/RNA-binding domain of Phe-tRNA-synthetase-like protein